MLVSRTHLSSFVQGIFSVILFVLRCSFVIPHGVLNYSCAVTDMTFVQFTIGNLGVLPVSLVWTYYGTQAATI